MIVGFIAGLPISLVATLDGLISGLMGGMMGAMLWEMNILEYHDAITKVMFFLYLGTLTILLKMTNQEVNIKEDFYRNYFLTIALFRLLFILF